MNGDYSKNFTADVDGLKQVTMPSMFGREQDDSLTFIRYCEKGISGSIPNTQCSSYYM